MSHVDISVLDVLLADPEGEWTVEALREAASQADEERSHVLELLVTLMHNRLLEPVPYQRELTVRLRSGAETAIRLLRGGAANDGRDVEARADELAGVATQQPALSSHDWWREVFDHDQRR